MDWTPSRLLCLWNFPGQEYWGTLPFPTPGDLLDAGIKPVSLASPTLTSGFFTNCGNWDTSSGSELYINWMTQYGLLLCLAFWFNITSVKPILLHVIVVCSLNAALLPTLRIYLTLLIHYIADRHEVVFSSESWYDILERVFRCHRYAFLLSANLQYLR